MLSRRLALALAFLEQVAQQLEGSNARGLHTYVFKFTHMYIYILICTPTHAYVHRYILIPTQMYLRLHTYVLNPTQMLIYIHTYKR